MHRSILGMRKGGGLRSAVTQTAVRVIKLTEKRQNEAYGQRLMLRR